jgi:hypothetical protein
MPFRFSSHFSPINPKCTGSDMTTFQICLAGRRLRSADAHTGLADRLATKLTMRGIENVCPPSSIRNLNTRIGGNRISPDRIANADGKIEC